MRVKCGSGPEAAGARSLARVQVLGRPMRIAIGYPKSGSGGSSEWPVVVMSLKNI